MRPRDLLLRRQGPGWHGYDETFEERAQGGLQPDEPEPQEEAKAQPMEEDDAAAAAIPDDSGNDEPWVLPTALEPRNPIVVAAPGNADGDVFWPIQAVPTGLVGLPPQILNATPLADPELLERQCAVACIRSVLPVAVCHSPLLMLLSSAAACGATLKAERPLSEAMAPTHPRYVTYIQAVILLHQWKSLVVECVTPFHETVRPVYIFKMTQRFKREVTAQEERHNDELDRLYALNAPLEDHARTWERHALEYIHLLEYFLYECLIVQMPNAPPLEHVLTPPYFPNAHEWNADLREKMRKDTLKFFEYKRDLAPTYGLAAAHLFDQTPPGMAPQPLWRGWFSSPFLATYREYLRDSDHAPVN